MSQDSINHHYVPQGLLRQWYTKSVNLKNKGFRKYKRNQEGEVELNPHMCSTKSSCSEIHLNTTYSNVFSTIEEITEDTNTIEHIFRDLDTKALNVIHKILKAPKEERHKLNSGEIEILSKMILSLHFRHPHTIEYANNEIENRGNVQLEFLEKISKNNNLTDHVDYFKKNTNLFTMLHTLNEPDSLEHIKNMNWTFFDIEPSFFFSGEKPLVVNFCKDEVVLDLGFAISLSPTVLFVGIRKGLFSDFDQEKDFMSEFVMSYNGIVSEQSHYIITDKELSDELLDIYVNRSLK